jgi:hypothetical protein
MALTNMQYQKEGVVRRLRGHLSGTYVAATVVSETVKSATSNARAVANATIAAGVMTITPGYVPSYVKIVNVTTRVMQEWFAGMNSGDFLETAAAGTRSLETDDKLVVNTSTGVITVTFNGAGVADNETLVYLVED